MKVRIEKNEIARILCAEGRHRAEFDIRDNLPAFLILEGEPVEEAASPTAERKCKVCGLVADEHWDGHEIKKCLKLFSGKEHPEKLEGIKRIDEVYFEKTFTTQAEKYLGRVCNDIIEHFNLLTKSQ